MHVCVCVGEFACVFGRCEWVYIHTCTCECVFMCVWVGMLGVLVYSLVSDNWNALYLCHYSPCSTIFISDSLLLGWKSVYTVFLSVQFYYDHWWCHQQEVWQMFIFHPLHHTTGTCVVCGLHSIDSYHHCCSKVWDPYNYWHSSTMFRSTFSIREQNCDYNVIWGHWAAILRGDETLISTICESCGSEANYTYLDPFSWQPLKQHLHDMRKCAYLQSYVCIWNSQYCME